MDADLTAFKTEARRAAFARREAAHAAGQGDACDHLLAALAPFRGRVIAGYLPIRTEIDPLPAMAALAKDGPVVVPVIDAAGQPLRFREWHPGVAMIDAGFGTMMPATGAFLEPEALIVPLVAFDADGNRLGYGGGFYDRTLQQLRALRPTFAAGFAFAAQQAPRLPLEPTDELLDCIITDAGRMV